MNLFLDVECELLIHGKWFSFILFAVDAADLGALSGRRRGPMATAATAMAIGDREHGKGDKTKNRTFEADTWVPLIFTFYL